MVGNSGSWKTEPPNSEDEWLPEGPIDPKKLLIRYIIQRIKECASPEEVLDEIPAFLQGNQLPKCVKSEAMNLIAWAIRTFRPEQR